MKLLEMLGLDEDMPRLNRRLQDPSTLLHRVDLEGTGVTMPELAGALARVGKVRLREKCPLHALICNWGTALSLEGALEKKDPCLWEPVLDIIANVGDVLRVNGLDKMIRIRDKQRKLLETLQKDSRYILRGVGHSGSEYYIIFTVDILRLKDVYYTEDLQGIDIRDAFAFTSLGHGNEVRPAPLLDYCSNCRFIPRQELLGIDIMDYTFRELGDTIPVAEFPEEKFERMLDLPMRDLKPFFDSVFEKNAIAIK